MDAVTFLGTGFSQPTAERHAISLHLQGGRGVLVDAGGDPAKGLAARGLLGSLHAVVITHHHTDHTGGLPALVHASRFVDRGEPLTVAGLPDVIERLERACGALDAQAPYGLEWVELPDTAATTRVGDVEVRTAPAEHTVPALAVRIGDVTYSSDTRPCDAVVDLAAGSQLLVHEATHPDAAFMERARHATAAEAGDVARRADVDALALVHLHPTYDPTDAVEQAGFEPVWTPRDGERLVRSDSDWRLEPPPQVK